jgi:hypothetical protein
MSIPVRNPWRMKTESMFSLGHALRVKSAEFWLELGQPAQAILELQKLPRSARRQPAVVKALVSATGTLRERNERNPLLEEIRSWE